MPPIACWGLGGRVGLDSLGRFLLVGSTVMPEITLAAESGRSLGTAPSNRTRRDGRVPAVVYGHGVEATPVSIDRKALRAALHTEAGHNAVINLEVAGETHLTIVKELQRHPVRNEVVHVDFLVVDRNQEVTVEVPIVLTGEAKSLVSQGGTIEQQLHTLTVQAKPGNIPNEIEIDITDIAVGDSIRVGDLKLPAGANTELDPEEPIVIGQLTRAGLEAEREEGEGEEGETEGEGGQSESASAEGEPDSEG